jgi:zinc protease
VLSEHFGAAFQLLAEVIRSPALPGREIDRLRHERLAELLELRTEPRGLADERYAGLLFNPASRYSLPEDGPASTVSRLTEAQCRAWHAARFTPAATTVVVCGDVVVADTLRVVSAALGDWAGTAIPTADVDDSPASTTRTVHLIQRTDAPQTELRIGHVGLRRNQPDYFDVVVMNAILGGVFNSRINLNLREEHAYTYGAFSSFDWRRDAGAFTVSTAVATSVTADATREVLRELDRMRSGPPTDEELSLATSYLDGVFPIRFETTEAIASALAMQRILDLPDDYFDTYRDRIRAVTAEGVARAACAHLHVDTLQVLAVGDSDTIRPGLEALDIGPVVDAPADWEDGH